MAHEDGQGTVDELIAVLAEGLTKPPHAAEWAMALVIDGAGRGDHLGLQARGQALPGGLSLLASAIYARAQPDAALLLEWVFAAEADGVWRRRYHGWAVCRDEAALRWRRLSVADLRAQADPRTGKPMGDDPLTTFEG